MSLVLSAARPTLLRATALLSSNELSPIYFRSNFSELTTMN
jgi:hypothetical protein